MRKVLGALLSIIAVLFFVFSAQAQQNSSSTSLIPEKNGDYPDPEHPGVRVRVFVHEPKEKTAPSVSTTCSDLDSSAPVGTTGWHLQSPVTYNLNTSSVPSAIGEGNLVTLSNDAFQTWSASAGGKVVFSQGSSTTADRSRYDGLNIVAWGRTMGTALAVTYIRYSSKTGLVVDVDTIMNKKFPWSWTSYATDICGNPDSYDAQDILTHELGHWMGLNDQYTSEYRDNTMYGYGAKGEIKKDTLTTGDTVNLSTIYP